MVVVFGGADALSKWVVLFGATSGIGVSLAHHLADAGYDLVLVGRNADETQRTANDLAIRHHVETRSEIIDGLAPNFVGRIRQLQSSTPTPLAGLVWAWGILGDRPATSDPATLGDLVTVNFTNAVITVETFLPVISDFVLLLSSVAGDRGRQSNYWYGATKAALTVFGQGLQHRLATHGPAVVIAKLGPVNTKMGQRGTANRGLANPDRVAQALLTAVERRRRLVYIPGYWRLVMWGIRHIPDSLFARLDW
jgi:decaprenylphospho-beta-D-erythro-pentofuranosid-2-ulose 2-reductase